jgi:putative ABC transport system permease protein
VDADGATGSDAGRGPDAAVLAAADRLDEIPALAARWPSALAARVAVVSAGATLFLGLGIVALLLGGIGIANVMVIAVLERRTEIGLRRALGGAAGLLLGAAVTAATAKAQHWGILIPPEALWGGPGLAIVIGSAAGLYPAARAARMSPTEALRSS